MNYSQKRTLIGRIVYIGLTLMAVTILCVTMYTFFGSSRQASKTPPITTAPAVTEPHTTKPTVTQPTEKDPPTTTDSKPTVVPPAKDWLSETISMPVDGTVVKGHDLLTAVYSLTMNDYRVHRGVDIACALGDDVVACAYGTVITVGTDPFMGTCVAIDHGDGLLTLRKKIVIFILPSCMLIFNIYP